MDSILATDAERKKKIAAGKLAVQQQLAKQSPADQQLAAERRVLGGNTMQESVAGHRLPTVSLPHQSHTAPEPIQNAPLPAPQQNAPAAHGGLRPLHGTDDQFAGMPNQQFRLSDPQANTHFREDLANGVHHGSVNTVPAGSLSVPTHHARELPAKTKSITERKQELVAQGTALLEGEGTTSRAAREAAQEYFNAAQALGTDAPAPKPVSDLDKARTAKIRKELSTKKDDGTKLDGVLKDWNSARQHATESGTDTVAIDSGFAVQATAKKFGDASAAKVRSFLAKHPSAAGVMQGRLLHAKNSEELDFMLELLLKSSQGTEA